MLILSLLVKQKVYMVFERRKNNGILKISLFNNLYFNLISKFDFALGFDY